MHKKSNNHQLVTKRLATLLLVQAGILPTNLIGLKPRRYGFQSCGEVLSSTDYWDRRRKEWRKNNG